MTMLGISCTATPHKKYQRHHNTANPHVPLPIQWTVTQVSLVASWSWGDWTVHIKLTSPIFTLLHNIDQLHKLISFHHSIIPKAFITFILSRKFSTKFCNSYKYYTLPLLRNLTFSFQYFDQKCWQEKTLNPKNITNCLSRYKVHL